MTLRAPLLAGALLLAAALPASADPEAYAKAGEDLGRALFLVAVDQGGAAARRLAERGLSPALGELLDGAGQSPRARELRELGDELELKAQLLEAVLAETPGARDQLALLGRAGRALDRELTRLEASVNEVALDVESLERDASKVLSVKAARQRRRGERLLLIASQAALIRHRLREELGSDERVAACQRFFDRDARPDALRLLRLVRQLDRHPAWLAVGGREDLRARVSARCGDIVERLRRCCAEAQRLLAGVRTRELRAVVAGKRSTPMSEVLPVLKAYRSQFNAVPDLEADPVWNLYWDRNDGRAHFWLPSQGQWVRGQARVDPVAPIVERLLAAQDPALQLLACRSHALATCYGLFPQPFPEGMAWVERSTGRLSQRLASLLEGLDPSVRQPADAALAREVGVPTRLLVGDGRAAGDHVLRVALRQGVPTARALSEGLAAAAQRLESAQLTLVGVDARGLTGDVPVDLAWDPPPPPPGETSPRWLVPPPTELRPGSPAWGVALGPVELRLGAFARDGRQVIRSEGPLAPARPGQPTSLELKPGAPGLDLRELSPGAVAARSLPLEAPPLELSAKGPGGEVRLLDASGRLVLSGRDPAGAWTLLGRDGRGEVVCERTIELGARRAVELGVGAADPALPLLKPKQALSAAVWEGGQVLGDAETRWILSDQRGVVVAQRRGARFRWRAEAAGRYLLRASGAAPLAFGVAERGPALVVSRTPWGEASSVAPGEGCFLRVDAWPHLLAEEVLEARWTLSDAQGKALRPVRVLPHPDHPGSALRLPLHLRPEARAGERAVQLTLLTRRGSLELSGALPLAGSSRSLELELWQGREPLAIGGEPARLRVAASLREAAWVLVGPAGSARRLRARPDGSVEVALAAGDTPGGYQLWLSGVDRQGRAVHGRRSLRALRVEPLRLSAPRRPVIGQPLRVTATPPRGFEGPFQIRRVGGEWQPGQSLSVEARASNELRVELRDAGGQLAAGELVREALPAQRSGGPRFGIAADTRTRRIFAADYALLSSYKQKGELPPSWAVLEQGPLTAAGARERIFLTVPYDGPGDGRQVAYTSVRFWDKLQSSARARFEAVGAEAGVPYQVLNTPSPGGEQTLFDEVARLLGEDGWTFRRVGVRVRGDGIEPLREAGEVADTVEVRLARRGVDQRGRDVDRVEVPGPLAEHSFAFGLPDQLDLDRSHRIVFSVSSLRQPIVPRRPYPAGWQLVAPKAQLAPRLSLALRLTRGEELLGETQVTLTRVGERLQSSDLHLWLEHVGTTRSPLAGGAPRAAERFRLHLLPHGGDPVVGEVAFQPLSPGKLGNVPERLELVLEGRGLRAVPAKAWPAELPRPKEQLRLGDELYLLETLGSQAAQVELVVVYERRAGGGPPLAPPAAIAGGEAALGALRAGGDPAKLAPVAQLLDAAAKDHAKQRLDAAEVAARQAMVQDALQAGPWGLLSDVALSRRDLILAERRALLALGLGEDARAALVLGRVRFLQGRFDEAAEAARRGLAAQPGEALTRRLEALQLEAQ